MGCNCNKKVKPLGTSGAQKSNTSPPTTAKLKRTSTPPPQGTTQSFTLQARDGSTATFGSRLEAEAARVRAGGGSIR